MPRSYSAINILGIEESGLGKGDSSMVHIPYLSLDPLWDALRRSGTLWDRGRSVSVGPVEKGKPDSRKAGKPKRI